MLGGFLSVDPLAEKYASWSPYNYVLGNPVILVDPDGRFPILPVVLGAIGGGFEYGNQVYNNYQSGDVGYDAWVGNVDFADVAVETGAAATGTKFFGTAIAETVKASIDIKGSGDIAYVGDGSKEKQVSNVLITAAKNTGISVVGAKAGEKLGEAVSDKALKQADRAIKYGKKNLDKAKRIGGRNASRTPLVYARDQQLSGAIDKRNAIGLARYIGFNTKPGEKVAEEITKTTINQSTDDD